ncbi:MAG: hypothetical protein JOZ60_01630 [Verrucomicrobia bacterium]|nr:hypothetical protein [Verrucomicrobiota bacterium]
MAEYSGTDAPGDQKDAKTEPSPKSRGKSVEVRNGAAASNRKSGEQRGVGASIVPNPRRGQAARREEGEKAKLIRGEGNAGD